jgi:cell division protein FtsB
MAIGYRQYQIQLWKNRLIMMILLVLCIFVAWSVYVRWQVEREIAVRREAAEAEYAELLERYDSLRDDVEYLRDERSFESEIRKRFDVAKAGESVIILVDDPVSDTLGVVSATTTSQTTLWWQFWQ